MTLNDFSRSLVLGTACAEDLLVVECLTTGSSFKGNPFWSVIEKAESIDDITQCIGQWPATQTAELLSFGVWCLRLYARCMWTGPELSPNEKEYLPKVFTDKAVTALLSTEGEMVENLIEVPGALYIGRMIVSSMSRSNIVAKWWLSRAALMLHRSLIGGINQCLCPQLRSEAISAIVSCAQQIGALPADFSLSDSRKRPLPVQFDLFGQAVPIQSDKALTETVLLEALAVFGMYGYADAFKEYLESACEKWPYNAELSGRMGIKRVHQRDAIPQLTVSVISNNKESETEPTELSEVPRNIDLSDLDENTDIYTRPKFTDGGSEVERSLSLVEKFYLLAWAQQTLSTCSSGDQLGMNIVVTITNEILHRTSSRAERDSLDAVTEYLAGADWSLWGAALYLRSRSEFERSKWKERSCLQILTLEEQFAKPEPGVQNRLQNLWLTPYPNKWELRREVGSKFLKLGAVLTARDMYAKMEMWTDVIQCLVTANRKNEAKDVLDEELKKDPMSPILWCLAGEITDEPTHFEKAWDFSNKKFHRAARSLGEYHFEKTKDLVAAKMWFSRAVTVQPYQPKTQFTYGCLLMQFGSYQESLSAFNAVISHDEDHYEAWANMGAIHCKFERWTSAKKCMQAAARIAQSKWRIWDSYTKICFKLDDVHGAFEGMSRLIDLDVADQIEIWMLHRLMASVTDASAHAQAVREDLLARVLEFFKNYFNKLRFVLPSQRKCLEPQNVFDTESIRACIDRHRIWCVLTETVGLYNETWEICLKGARLLCQVIEDCLTHESPHTLWGQHGCYAKFVEEELLKLWARTVNEIVHYRTKLREHTKDLQLYDQQRVESVRFIETSFTRIHKQVEGCSLMTVEERKAIINSLIEMERSL